MGIATIGSPLAWTVFAAVVLVMLAIDLGVAHRRPHAVGLREAMAWSGVWIAVALLFSLGVYREFGGQAGMEFLTGYVIEKSLSVDNLFVFAVIFSACGVAAQHQHRVLFWGVVGALILRGVFVLAGTALMQSFHWIIYVFGALLVITGAKLLRRKPDAVRPQDRRLFRWFQRAIPTTGDFRGARFVVRENGRWLATPLLAVVFLVEVTDVMFAVDSVPAVFAVTSDPFIVYTSNIFAILGLRSLYFLIANAIGRIPQLNTGVSIILVFVGVKMLVADVVKIPVGVSLAVIAGVLAATVLVGQARRRRRVVKTAPVRGAEEVLL